MAAKKDESKKKSDKDSKSEKSEKTNINFDGFTNILGSTTKIVHNATKILEEEIAKGIIAAKQVEDKFFDVNTIREGNEDELITRFRKDGEEIWNLFVDFASITLRNMGNFTSQFINLRQDNEKEVSQKQKEQSRIPLIQVPKELKPKDKFELPITLENDSAIDIKSIFFETTPLVDTKNNILPPSTINFDPNPLVLQPESTGTVKIKINIPSNAKEGSYSCFIQGKDLNILRATLVLNVVK